MDISTLSVAIVAVITAIGAIIKQVCDTRELKRWICYRNPCDDRVTKQEALQSKTRDTEQ